MKTIPLGEMEEQAVHYDSIAKVLDSGGLVCLPCGSSYRVVADLTNESAVNRLLQSKRRTRKAPSLVFVDGRSMLDRVTDEVDPLVEKLVERMWPGRLTILFSAHPELPRKVVKQICKATGKIGVRVPEEDHIQMVIRRFGRPLLVSSANKEKKAGAGSPAQVRKTFIGRVDVFVDAWGSAPEAASSTVVDFVKGKVVVTRPGAISAEALSGLDG